MGVEAVDFESILVSQKRGRSAALAEQAVLIWSLARFRIRKTMIQTVSGFGQNAVANQLERAAWAWTGLPERRLEVEKQNAEALVRVLRERNVHVAV